MPTGVYKRTIPPWNKGKRFPAYTRENSFHWKGGRSLTTNGYIRVYMPNHPSNPKHGYVFEHRLIMERYIGRTLNPNEVVHHINGNHSDNRIKNLILFSNRSEHMKLHIKNGLRFWRLKAKDGR